MTEHPITASVRASKERAEAIADQLGTTPAHLVSDELDNAEAEIERLRGLLEMRDGVAS